MEQQFDIKKNLVLQAMQQAFQQLNLYASNTQSTTAEQQQLEQVHGQEQPII